MNKFIDILFKSNLIIALAAIAQSVLFRNFLQQKWTISSYDFFLFFSTGLTYSLLQNYKAIKERTILQHKSFLILILSYTLGTFYFVFFLNIFQFTAISTAFLLVFLFTLIRFHFFHFTSNNSFIAIIKFLYIPLVWCICTLIANYQNEHIFTLILLSFFQISNIAISYIPFEKRDMERDAAYSMPNISTLFKKANLTFLCVFFLLIQLVTYFFLIKLSFYYQPLIAIIFFNSIVYFLTIEKKNNIWFYGLIDGYLVFQLLIIYLAL